MTNIYKLIKKKFKKSNNLQNCNANYESGLCSLIKYVENAKIYIYEDVGTKKWREE